MKSYIGIEDIRGREILDSRGMPTLEVEVYTDTAVVGRASVPSLSSLGMPAPSELRDGDGARYGGMGVRKAVKVVNEYLGPKLRGLNIIDQRVIDGKMADLDGTEDKSRLGSNSIFGVSSAAAHGAANALGLGLYQYLGGIAPAKLPVPVITAINGGRVPQNGVDLRALMIVPLGAKNFSQGIMWSARVLQTLKNILWERGLSPVTGDEGGLVPNLRGDEDALRLILSAISRSGFKAGIHFALAVDAGADDLYGEAEKAGEPGQYYFPGDNKMRTSEEMIRLWQNLSRKYPIVFIESALAKGDIEGWEALSDKLEGKVKLALDTSFAPNLNKLKKASDLRIGNSISLSPAQVGTLTETFDMIEFAGRNGYSVILSPCVGETEDTAVADMAVAARAEYIKLGSLFRGEHIQKCNRLLKIEGELNL